MDYLAKLESLKGSSPQQSVEEATTLRDLEIELSGRSLTLTGAAWEGYMLRVLEAEDVPESIRREAVYRSLGTWISNDPRSALKMIAEAPDFFGGDFRNESLLNFAIHHLAKMDPVAAADLVRRPAEGLADFVNDRTRMSLITGTAFKDPALALQLVDEMKPKNRHDALTSIAENLTTPKQKTAVLAAMRDRLPALADDGARQEISQAILSGLASTFGYGNFGEARQWFDFAKLTPAELATFSRNLQSSILRPETGLWIEWLGPRLQPDDSRSITSSMMRSWTENDHRAAAQWLSSTSAEAPVKNIAIASFAEVISKYEPEMAARWALNIPAGKERDNSLRIIHHNWPAAKAATRDAFAKENGFTWP